VNALRARSTLVGGLALGAAGIAILWAAGLAFPVAVPPGLVILLVGAVVVAVFRTRWSAGVGSFLGLFVLVGFAVSGTGFDNVAGQEGTLIAVGQVIEVIGVLIAAVSGTLIAARGD